ncbi:NAD(P)H-dependent oxidoreductase [Mucilaginibacter sp.]|jgi:NAD(P)H dehydrogenase (quinone)|uniref:NAD(P)H-dependent oxidoreductase n=1 Tax=Mucilaginibacter sp. TaxID=1882438 RepID=UPI00356680F1
MNILIVYAHPEPQSINGALFRAAEAQLTADGHVVKTTDLYKMRFDPISDRLNFTSVHNPLYFKQQLEEIYATGANTFAELIRIEQEKVEWCDLMIWQFPLWWFSVPAILKGWVDRVFAMGRFYKTGYFYETGVFKGKKALLSITTGSPADAYLKDGLQGDLDGILKPIHRGILGFTGFSVLRPHVVYGPVRNSKEENAAEINNWKERLSNISEESPVNVGRY